MSEFSPFIDHAQGGRMAAALERIADAQEGKASVLSDLEKEIAESFIASRTGKVFATKIYRYASNTSSAGERLKDSASLTCAASTDTTEGEDDFTDASPIFRWTRCNYTRDDDGTARPTALEGSPNYKTTGAYDVGNVYATFWWNVEHHGTYDIYYMADAPHPELGLVPWCEAVKTDGTVLPFYVHSAFAAITASDGLLRSQPGMAPAYNNSYNSMITAFQKKGTGYWGAGSERNLWGMLMLIIKYATKNVQKIFNGHVSTSGYSIQVAYAETGVKRVLLADNNAGFYAGACISIGSASADWGTATSHDIADRVKILSVESVTIDSTVYTALNLELSSTITTATTYYVKFFPSFTAETDQVIGHNDGSYLSNTDGRHPFRILGTEFAWGQAFIESNSMSEKDSNGDWLQYFAPKGTAHVANAHTGYVLAGKIPVSSGDYWSGDIDVDTRGMMWPSTIGGSDSTGTGDRVWGPQSGSAGDLQERYTVGALWFGSVAGLAYVDLRFGLSDALWDCGCCD